MTDTYMIQQYLKTNKPKKFRTSYRDTAASKDVMKYVNGKISQARTGYGVKGK